MVVRIRPGAVSLRQRLNLFERHRLFDDYVDAQTTADLTGARMRGRQDDWYVGNSTIPQLKLAELLAPHPRHHEVEHDETRMALTREPKRLGAVVRRDGFDAEQREARRQHRTCIDVVFDDEDRVGWHTCVLASRLPWLVTGKYG
jgi:hypothetical protein